MGTQRTQSLQYLVSVSLGGLMASIMRKSLGQKLLSLLATLCLALFCSPLVGQAMTAPELRGGKSLQDLQPNMHGRNLQQQEFLKADLQKFDFSEADLRGAVFNNTQLQGASLNAADLRDAVAFASRFDAADLRQARLDNAMLLQSHFRDSEIDGADFSDAVLDMQERKALCARASGTNNESGISTADSLGCRSNPTSSVSNAATKS